MPILHRPSAINDALDILSSCYHELDIQLANTPLFTVVSYDIDLASIHIDHAMAYLEKEYTK